MKTYPDLLSADERRELLKMVEWVWKDLQENKLGGYSDGNRPFYLMWKFEEAIEKFGRRDIGNTWSPQELAAHPNNPSTVSQIKGDVR